MEPGIVGGENADVLWRLSIACPAWDTSHCSLQPAQTGELLGEEICVTPRLRLPATASEFRRCSQSHSHPLRSSPQLESSEHLHLSPLRASGGSLCHSHHHHHRHQHWYCPQPAGVIRWEGLLSTGHLISLEAPLRGGVASGETFISSLPPASYRSLKTVV